MRFITNYLTYNLHNPTNITRTTTSVQSYLYLTDKDNLYINLFMKSESKLDFCGRTVIVNQETDYPWDGELKFKLNVDKPSSFTIKIRVPGWAREEAIPLGLYRYKDKINRSISIKVNGEEQKVSMDKGYALIHKKWQAGEEITLSLPMEIRRVLSDEKVKENNGRVALERGPLVYCAEWVYNNGKTSNIILPDESVLSCKFVKDLIGGITVIKVKLKQLIRTERQYLLILPLYPIFPGLTEEEVKWIYGYQETLLLQINRNIG